MCIATAAIAATAMQAVGSVMGGDSQRRALDTQADEAKAQAGIAAQAGYAREAQVRQSWQEKLGSQYAASAGSGIDPNSGSAAAAERQSAISENIDALNTRYSGLTQMTQLQQQSNNDRASASQANLAGYIGAATAIAGGASGYYAQQGRPMLQQQMAMGYSPMGGGGMGYSPFAPTMGAGAGNGYGFMVP